MIFSRKNKLFWGNLTLTGALIFGAPVFALADKAPDPSEIQGPVRKPQEENKAVQKNGDSDNLSGKTDGNNKDRETEPVTLIDYIKVTQENAEEILKEAMQ